MSVGLFGLLDFRVELVVANGAFEFLDASTKGAGNARDSASAEEQQNNHQNDQEFGYSKTHNFSPSASLDSRPGETHDLVEELR
jgi:hypothetical protein